jgi:hypothetical protein
MKKRLKELNIKRRNKGLLPVRITDISTNCKELTKEGLLRKMSTRTVYKVLNEHKCRLCSVQRVLDYLNSKEV